MVDEDIFFPGTVVRNELDLKVTGAHKASGLRERLTDLAPNVAVKALRMSLGGQEKAGAIVGRRDRQNDHVEQRPVLR